MKLFYISDSFIEDLKNGEQELCDVYTQIIEHNWEYTFTSTVLHSWDFDNDYYKYAISSVIFYHAYYLKNKG